MPLKSGLGEPEDWLKRARSNLARARQPKTDEIFWEDLCFDAQQAVEKSIKAILLFYRVDFPFVHNIAALLTLVEKSGIELTEEIRVAADLTDYAVMARYPGTAEEVSEEEYRNALRIAEVVFLWASEIVGEHSS